MSYKNKPLPASVPGPEGGAVALCRPPRLVNAGLYWASRFRKHLRPEKEVMFWRPLLYINILSARRRLVEKPGSALIAVVQLPNTV